MPDLALLDIAGPVATLSLNRPEKRNALSLDLIDALHQRVDALGARDDVVAVVLTGADPTFCAGMDLKAVLKQPGAPMRLLRSIAELTIKLRTLAPVVIAKVNGAAIGGGCGLMCVCDLAFTHPEAKIGYPEVDIGVCPAVVAPWLVQRVGAGRARQLLLMGGLMTGAQAGEAGLVTRVVERDALVGEVEALAARLASADPGALRETKVWMNRMEGERLADVARRGAEVSANVVETPEARAALAQVFANR